MNNLVKVLSYIGVAALSALLFFLFIYRPDVKKAHNEGLVECLADKDTVYLPGKDSLIYRDTTIYLPVEPVTVEKKDSSIMLATSIDTSMVSGKDTIKVKATAVVKVSGIDSANVAGFDLFKDVVSQWLMKIVHTDYLETPDTVKIITIKEKPVPADIMWYRTDTFAYIVSGVIYLITVLGYIL